jgi:hypothetical protein
MTYRLERFKNFIAADECAKLNAWVDEGVAKKWLDVGISRGNHQYDKRVTSRLYAERFTYPEFVRQLSERVRKFCGVSDYGLIEGHGRDGVVVSCTSPGGDVYAHKDPRSASSLATLRCNILTRAGTSGGVLHLEGEPILLEVGELHCYLVSEHTHFATEVTGSTSRVMWMFGAHVPKEDWDSSLITFGH